MENTEGRLRYRLGHGALAWGARSIQKAVFGLQCLALGACVSQAGEEQDTGQPPRGVSPATYYCAVLCRRLGECAGGGFSRLACETSCASTSSTFFETTADALLTRTAACYAKQSCAAFADETAYPLCFEEAMVDLAPSPQCEEFCRRDTAETFECGGGYGVEDCLSDGVCGWSDSVLAEATACIELDCEARVLCQNAVFVDSE